MPELRFYKCWELQEGDEVSISLIQYTDDTLKGIFADDFPEDITVYNVILERHNNNDFYAAMPTKVRHEISETLAKFILKEEAILSYWCDHKDLPVSRRDSMLPQEVRSKLFFAMFKRYIEENSKLDIYHRVISPPSDATPQDKHFVHFLFLSKHRKIVDLMDSQLMHLK